MRYAALLLLSSCYFCLVTAFQPLPLPPEAFASGLCCPSDPGPLCPGDGNYRRPVESLPTGGPQCVCFNNQTMCNGIVRMSDHKNIQRNEGGELIIFCSGQEGQKVPYVEEIDVNGEGNILMWAEIGEAGGTGDTILTREYTNVFNDSLAITLNAIIQDLGVEATGKDLTLSWMVNGGPTGLSDLSFTIDHAICLRPRLLRDGEPIPNGPESAHERGLLTCVVGKLTPLPLGGCPSLGIFGSASMLNARYSILMAATLTFVTFILHA